MVAEMRRTLARRVRDEPRRSKSPVSSTRSSLFCWLSGTLAISSRNSVPPSAISKRPTRSALASVKAPRTWPKSSLSKTPSETPPALTVTSGRAARGDTAWSACATSPLPVPFSPVIRMLASDGPTRAIICSTGCIAGASAMRCGCPSPRSIRFSASSRWPRRSARDELDLGAHDGEEPRVVPRLLDEVAGAAAHRLDGDVDAAPGRHHHRRQRRVHGADRVEEIETLPGPTSCRGRSSGPSGGRRIPCPRARRRRRPATPRCRSGSPRP